MTIKGKPKNLDSFLSGPTERGATGSPAPRSAQRVTKTIRISPDVEAALKEAAYTQTKASGRRVTESDVIDDALKQYLNI